jgi:tRNA G10  N-methylase Trm11
MADKVSLITLPFVHKHPAPSFEGQDICFPESLVRYFLKTCTRRGDKVFDPFAGLGTTLFTAEEMGRDPYGIEADSRRHAWVAGQLKGWQQLVHGDSAKLASYGFPRMDFCMTSPPYMPRHHRWNPLFAGNPRKAGYAFYLKQLETIFGEVAKILKPGSLVVVQADNLHHGRIYTPLVRDMSVAVSKKLTLQGEIIVRWNPAKPDYAHTHCLLFKRT